MRYTSRGMRRRRNTDKWEVTLSHKDPVTGERLTSYHTVEAKTERQAEKKRDELIMELERKGAAAGSKLLVAEFFDLRHTFATMMIASGTDVRTVASYLGHANVAMTLNTYADVDPDAKRAAVSKVEGAFDVDMSSIVDQAMAKEDVAPSAGIVFTVEQLEAMLAMAKKLEKAGGDEIAV